MNSLVSHEPFVIHQLSVILWDSIFLCIEWFVCCGFMVVDLFGITSVVSRLALKTGGMGSQERQNHRPCWIATHFSNPFWIKKVIMCYHLRCLLLALHFYPYLRFVPHAPLVFTVWPQTVAHCWQTLEPLSGCWWNLAHWWGPSKISRHQIWG